MKPSSQPAYGKEFFRKVIAEVVYSALGGIFYSFKTSGKSAHDNELTYSRVALIKTNSDRVFRAISNTKKLANFKILVGCTCLANS